MAAPTTRPDVRLDDLPMTPVECQTCRAVVDVRKASWHQTSIQWNERAVRMCPERSAIPERVSSSGLPTCPALRDSIARAAVSGDLSVVDAGI
ncbi:ferredoxin [Nocardioides sp. JQ2195]|uniref:ferredoxin n=1 Tax=Nocardioides sp. JQ2195 TaxID=2592334 RepID=UPI00143EC41D|nr:ferredoxin [Nocardioides sp. JQ2195]QIX26537.1 ferredoxin [Nocardioides sp. JQ2195]